MRSAFERSNEADLAVDNAIHTSMETGAPTFVNGDPFTHNALATAVKDGGITVGSIGGYRATTYTGPSGWIVTAIEAP